MDRFQLGPKIALVMMTLFVFAAATCARADDTLPTSNFLQWPVDCTYGEDCYILKYVDLGPAGVAQDLQCRHLTADNHRGTDIATLDQRHMRRGVNVLAAAAGEVVQVRDGIYDRTYDPDAPVDPDQSCGNTVTLAHDNGFTTRYCHLRRGSVQQTFGTRVQAGDVIGQIGASGWTSFPHLHFSVWHDGKPVDPFIGRKMATGCQKQSEDGTPDLGRLWADNVAYTAGGVVKAGLVGYGLEDYQEILDSTRHESQIDAAVKRLSAFIVYFGYEPGQALFGAFVHPDGRRTVIVDGKTYDSPLFLRSHSMFLRGSTATPFEPGMYAVEWSLKDKNGATVWARTVHSIVE